MIKNIVDMLNLPLINETPNIRFAKGYNSYPNTFKNLIKLILWHSKG